MDAAVLREYGEPLAVEQRPAPEPAPDGAVVAVEACGVCRSDWHAWRGHGEWNDDRVESGQVLGHEPAGEVVAVGAEVESLAGRADVSGGDRVAVHGCGGLGLAAVEIADALGGSVVAVDVRDGPLGRARELGAAATVDATAVEDVPAAVHEHTDGGAHVSVDALGRAETCRNSVRSLRARGTHVQVGLTTDAERGEVALPTDFITRWDLSVLGSRGMPPSRYPQLLRMMADGTLDPGALVSRELALGEVSERLAAMTDYETEGVEVVTEL